MDNVAEEVKRETNLTEQLASYDITDTVSFDSNIESKFNIFKQFVTDKSYYDIETDIEKIEFIAYCITVNYVNRWLKNLQHGPTWRVDDFNTFDVNTYLLIDQNIQELMYDGYRLIPSPEREHCE